MNAALKTWIREYLCFSSKDRNSTLILSSLIILLIAFNMMVGYIDLKPEDDNPELRRQVEAWLASDSIEHSKKLFEFDPNTIDKAQLDSLPLPASIKRNLVKYRAAGGNFQSPADVRKLYGMNDSIFSEIERYIRIGTEFRTRERTHPWKPAGRGASRQNINGTVSVNDSGPGNVPGPDLIKDSSGDEAFGNKQDLFSSKDEGRSGNYADKPYGRLNDSLNQLVTGFYEADAGMVELNRVDSAGLVRLPGIGPVFASRIIRYRQLLGGFYSVSQLLEVYHFPEQTYRDIYKGLWVDTTFITPLRINFADFGELLRHPYLEIEDVKKIMDYRDSNGPFKDINQLADARLLSHDTYKRIRPYISCR